MASEINDTVDDTGGSSPPKVPPKILSTIHTKHTDREKEKSDDCLPEVDCSPAVKCFHLLVCCIAGLTCQLIPSCCVRSKKEDEDDDACTTCFKATCSFFLFLGIAFAAAINILPVAFFISGWVSCPYNYSSICYTVEPFTDIQNSKLSNLVLRNTDQIDTDIKKGLIQEFIDFSKIALLFSTTSSAVSHTLFIFALWCLYVQHWDKVYTLVNGAWNSFQKFCCGIKNSQSYTKKPLDPFNDTIEDEDLINSISMDSIYTLVKNKSEFFEKEDERTSTPLQGERLCHFISWFIIICTLLLITIIVFFVHLQSNDASNKPLAYGLELSAIILYFISLCRNSVSCFIFSKLMYGIQRRCEEIELYVYHINEKYPTGVDGTFDDDSGVKDYVKKWEPAENEQQNKKKLALKYLIYRDTHFVKTAVATLSWIQLWFLFHWLLHIISTFMVTTLLIDAITLHVKERTAHYQTGINFHPGEIGFLFMYSLVQCFFLFYPCLRAASVTRTRQRVIRKISEEYRFSNIPDDVLNDFTTSMKRQRFSFRLRILCASMLLGLLALLLA